MTERISKQEAERLLAEYPTLRAANVARQQEWDTGNQITLAYRGNELAGEVGEACNIIKKLERERLGIRGSRASLAMLAERLSDVPPCVEASIPAEWLLAPECLSADMQGAGELAFLKHRQCASHLAVPAIYRAILGARDPMEG